MRPRSGQIIRTRFHDAEEFADLAGDWDVDFRQLTPGGFTGDLWQVTDGGSLVVRCRLSAHVHQLGSAPGELRTFAILADPAGRTHWRGQIVTGDQLMCFPRDGDLESVSPPGFDVFTMTFDEAELEAAAHDLDLSGRLQLGRGGMVIDPDSVALGRLRRLLLELHGASAAPTDAWFRAVLKNEVPQALVSALAVPEGLHPVSEPTPRNRDLALRRALRFVESRPADALTVADLCREARVSERTLQYAFREHFGIRPKAFLRARRLHGARQALCRTSAGSGVVSEIANLWGFWHLGQFAGDYARLFGERPSDTLTRTASGRAKRA